MRYELNFDEDKVNDVLCKGGASYDLKGCCDIMNEQQAIIKQLESDKAIAEDYANIFEMENVKLRKKLNKYKATVLGFLWIMEQNGRISGKDDKIVKELFKELDDE